MKELIGYAGGGADVDSITATDACPGLLSVCRKAKLGGVYRLAYPFD